MDPAIGKYIGAGLAAIAARGAGIGIGTSSELPQRRVPQPRGRRPAVRRRHDRFALAEATGLFGLLISILLLFVIR